MKFLTLFTSLSAALLPLVHAAPAPPPSAGVSIESSGGPTSGRHIVILKPESTRASVLGQVASINGGKQGEVSHNYDSVFNGFAGKFDDATLNALRTSPGVAAIVEDTLVKASATQTNAPWGLGRINSKRRLGVADSLLTFTYKYDDRAGDGVDIYVVDTGVRTSHTDFGGRAVWGTAVGGYAQTDGNGHGTHCAGTAIGGQYGVAKRARVYAVKVLGDDGSGWTSDVIAGMEWSLAKSKTTGRPSVVSMSLGGGPNTAMDAAARKLISEGVHVVVAAGNDNADASNYSPARVSEVITVGATTIQDERASFSNFGSVVDILAPGQNVISTWKDTDFSINSLSGTSMATPHVAGLVAYLISIHGNMTPAAMRQKIRDLSLINLINPYTLPSGHTNMAINNRYQN